MIVKYPRHVISRLLMFTLLVATGIALPGAWAGNSPAVPPEVRRTGTGLEQIPTLTTLSEKGNPKLDAGLQQLVTAFRSGGIDAARQLATTLGVEMDGESVRVVVEGSMGQGHAVDLAREAIDEAGAQLEVAHGDLLQIMVPLARLEGVATSPAVRFVRRPYYGVPDVAGESVGKVAPAATPTPPGQAPGSTVSEGVGIVGAEAWHAVGYSGAGVSVAIIDAGFQGYDSLLGSELPPSVTTRNFRADDNFEATRHGVAMAEIVHDVAPNANMLLVAVNTDVELLEAVNWLVERGVDIITSGVTWLDQPFDGTGELARKVDETRANGILWAQSAGGSARRHWEGDFTDDDEDGWHEYVPGDEANGVELEAGDYFQVHLSWWDWPASNNDYDLYLYNSDLSEVVASSRDVQDGSQPPHEYIGVNITDSGTYYLAIQKFSGSPRHLELYTWRYNFERYVESSSLHSPSDANGALTVGATRWSNDALESSSSRGPTDDGRTKPDLAAPDGVSNVTYGTFYGTSAATAHVAGAAALVKEAFPAYTADQIQTLLEERAQDLGAAGKDNQYGSGRLWLGEAPNQEPPADLLFSDDFGNPDSGWSQPSTDVADRFYANGEFHIVMKQPHKVAWSSRVQLFSDFDVRVRARAVETTADASSRPEARLHPDSYSNAESQNGPATEANQDLVGTYDLLFRYADGDNFYRFEVSPFAQWYRFSKQVNGEWVTIRSDTSPNINAGTATNELRVVAEGPNISLYVNGQHLADVTDTSFTHGWFALSAGTFDASALHVAFDNLVVYGPGAGGDIFGQVRFNRAPAPGDIKLALRFFNGSSWMTGAATVAAGGGYHFPNMPGLNSGQKYYVRYNNAGEPGNLWSWSCNTITTYTAGSAVAGCDFDIADVPLGLPDGEEPLSVPVTFNWVPRGFSPSETYRLHIWDPESDAEYLSDDLGHVSSATLHDPPDGFVFGKQYSWDVWVYGPDGGGVSYNTHVVEFKLAGPSVRLASLPLILRNHGTVLPSIPLRNGDFETGSFAPYWASGGELPTSIAGGSTPHAGNYVALLGQTGETPGTNLPVGSGWVEQEFTVPRGGSPALSFWYRIYTFDKAYSPSTGDFWDTLVVKIGDTILFRDGYCWHKGNTNQSECVQWTPQLRDLGWQRGQIDLSSYQGQRVTLRFAIWNDEAVVGKTTNAGAYYTWTYLDDIQLTP